MSTPEKKIAAGLALIERGIAEWMQGQGQETSSPVAPQPIEYPDLLTVSEVARYCRVTVQTVYGWIHRSENPLPLFPVPSSAKRIERAKLEAWLHGTTETGVLKIR